MMSEKTSAADETQGAPFGVRVGQWGFAPIFAAPLGSGRAAATPIELWISLFPAAPLFGLRWFFADIASGAAAGGEDAPSSPDVAAPGPGRSEKARLDQVSLRAPKPEPTGEAAEDPYRRAVSLDDVGVGAISDLSALGGVAARFSSDLGSEPRLRVVREKTQSDPETESRKLGATRLASRGGSARAAARAAAAPTPKISDESAKALEPPAPSDAAADKEATAPSAPKAGGSSRAKAKAPAAPKTSAKTSSKPAPKPVSKTAPKAAAGKGASSSKGASASSAASGKKAAPKAPRPTKKAGQPFATYDAPPPNADDLTRIKGVGQKLAAVLNDRGVYTFAQVARFDKAAYAWLDETLGAFKGRGERDDWAGQAKDLLK